MNDPFVAALAHVLAHEGGYVDHPKDPGGCTNLGVTRHTLMAWTGERATCEDVRNLKPVDVRDIYRILYWSKVRGDALPLGVALVVFDHAVNAGPMRAIKMLQSLLGVEVDGILGHITLSAAARADPEDLIQAFELRREHYYRSLRHFGSFGRGWLARARAATQAALAAP